jgi:hypothetical protein
MLESREVVVCSPSLGLSYPLCRCSLIVNDHSGTPQTAALFFARALSDVMIIIVADGGYDSCLWLECEFAFGGVQGL